MVSKYIEKLQLEIRDQDIEIHRLRSVLKETIDSLTKLYRKHYTNEEDLFYSCPQSPDCANEDIAGGECNCGAQHLNDRLEVIISRLDKVLEVDSESVR